MSVESQDKQTICTDNLIILYIYIMALRTYVTGIQTVYLIKYQLLTDTALNHKTMGTFLKHLRTINLCKTSEIQ